MMKAFHSNWTKPFFINHPDEEYYIEDFDLLVTILSALKWRQKNGSIKMYTDKLGGDYCYSLGLSEIYDLGIDTSLEEIVPKALDPLLFWAGGKIYSLKMEEVPTVMLDMDFVIWDSIFEEIKGQDLCVSHREILGGLVYPEFESFSTLYKYDYDEEWDWKVNPCNTALVYFGNEGLKDYFVDEAIKFMNSDFDIPKEQKKRVILMVFAEQRLLAMCAKKKGIEIASFISNNMDIDKYKKYTHVWGYKSVLLNSEYLREEFCKSCIDIILNDFPHMYDTLNKIPSIQRYLKGK